ncbi:MAG: phosphohydrolase [Rhodocyclales bacterium RIFCSPLOWO2_02_FULL_63_24]|nr:MAG: phosphohydrolase [Rhodocyclales bacterium GWA2_65_19]OHC68754.1 MAG: phosphohydrolase [Rhodocyclales bacterium RIFCSPLOWO2_02_FULL_63_24]
MNLLKDIGHRLGGGDQSQRRFQEDLLTSLLVMAWMVEARDPYTGGHLWRVSRFSRLLATDAGLAESDVGRISVGGFLHDLGKISVPDHILGKKDRLTDDEYAVIKTHPEVGWRMLAGHPLAQLAEAAIRAHHETPDGGGYPRGLRGLDVPLDARIVGICDAFDAMTSTRPYRRGMPVDKALGIIEDNLGRQFDRELGQRFVVLGRQGRLEHIVGHSDEGIPLRECMMCGPTLVLRRGQQAGDHVYCPSCTGEYAVEQQAGQLVTVATGRMASAVDLEPEADTVLITNVVREAARSLLAS